MENEMNLVELSTKEGKRFLFDMDSQWEIHDKSSEPALWTNYVQGRNLDCSQTYEDIRRSMYGSMMPTTLRYEP
jgi:hypothetical protein